MLSLLADLPTTIYAIILCVIKNTELFDNLVYGFSYAATDCRATANVYG